MSWKLCFLLTAKRSFENQVRSQTEVGNEEAKIDKHGGLHTSLP